MQQPMFYYPPDIQVILANEALWKQFYPVTEMMVLPQGRVIFPHLNYKITGLDVEAMYQIFIYLERVDMAEYKYIDGEWRKLVGRGVDPFPTNIKEHCDGARKGDHWMNGVVSFKKLRITNYRIKEDKRTIAVQTGHKFRPVVVVRQVGHYRGEEFRISFTEFIVVSIYYSKEMVALKIAHNKYAAAHRSKKEKPDSDGSSSSTTPAPATDVQNTDHSLHSDYPQGDPDRISRLEVSFPPLQYQMPTVPDQHQISNEAPHSNNPTPQSYHQYHPRAAHPAPTPIHQGPNYLQAPVPVQNQNQFSNSSAFSIYHPAANLSTPPLIHFDFNSTNAPSTSYQHHSNYQTRSSVHLQHVGPHSAHPVFYPTLPPQNTPSAYDHRAFFPPHTLPAVLNYSQSTGFPEIIPANSVSGDSPLHSHLTWTAPTNPSEVRYYSQVINVQNPYYDSNDFQT